MSYFLTSRGYRIAFAEWGERENPRVLLCVHGLSRNGRDFDFFARALSREYRVICPDVVGRGMSDWPGVEGTYVYANYIADILELLAHLKVSQVDWVGTSMGGLIAMMTLPHFPSVVRKLVLNDVGPLVPGKSLERILKYVTDWPIFARAEEAEPLLRKKLSTFGIQGEAEWRHMLTHSVKQRADGSWVLAYDPHIVQVPSATAPVEDVNLWHLWEEIRVPTLILRGGLSDVLLADTARAMVDTHPNASLITFEGVGHAPALMNEAQITVVRDWLLSGE